MMAINLTDFIDAYIQSLKDDGVSFAIQTYTDIGGNEVEIDPEQLTRDKLEIFAQDMWHHFATEIVTTSVDLPTPSPQNQIILADVSTGDIVVTLPSASTTSGKTILVKRTDSSSNIVTVSGTIDGGSSYVIYDTYGQQSFFSDGIQYWTVDSSSLVQRGTQSFSSSSSEVISFSDPLPSTNYRVTVELSGNPGGGWWITAKSTSGFTLNFNGAVSLDARWEARI